MPFRASFVDREVDHNRHALWMQEDLAHTVAQAFVQFDTGCKGYLTRHELRVAHVAVLGHAPSQVELDAMLPKRTDGAAAADDGR
jgi:hypothetical protein